MPSFRVQAVRVPLYSLENSELKPLVPLLTPAADKSDVPLYALDDRELKRADRAGALPHVQFREVSNTAN